jgi:ATP-dependent DNA helicase RecG
MNRILEGDVGTGKTIVAVISAYLAYLNGYKTLYMAPTEILAKQHFDTFQQFLNGKGPKVELKTSSKRKLDEDWNILIGTHALLFAENNYEKIGLVVIDEQHRFGVEQRGKIIELGKGKKTPHLLIMTATPIPRTLALTLYGDLAISVLKEHPVKQRDVKTRVVTEKQREEAYKWIRDKKEPTFIVCPLIEESEHESMENVKAAEAEYENLKK